MSGPDALGPIDYSKLEENLGKWSSSSYDLLGCNMDPDHDDVEIAGNADFVHHDSGEQFSWDGWTSVVFITSLKHDGNFSLRLKSTDNDLIPFRARGDRAERILGEVTAIYFNNSGTSGENWLLLEGY